MKGRYRVTFCDNTTEELDADNANQAKLSAKNDRIRRIDPGGTMRLEDRRTNPCVKVTKVEEIAS